MELRLVLMKATNILEGQRASTLEAREWIAVGLKVKLQTRLWSFKEKPNVLLSEICRPGFRGPQDQKKEH